MKFITHALIGIAFYEGIRYLINKKDSEQLDLSTAGSQKRPSYPNQDKDEEFAVPLTGLYDDEVKEDDPWKNSLANDEMRAPDS